MLEKDKRQAKLSILDRLRRQGSPTATSPVPGGFDEEEVNGEEDSGFGEVEDMFGMVVRAPTDMSSSKLLRNTKKTKRTSRIINNDSY